MFVFTGKCLECSSSVYFCREAPLLSNEIDFMRIAAAVAAIVFSAIGVIMLRHNSINNFGLGLSVGLLMAAIVALIEFVRRR